MATASTSLPSTQSATTSLQSEHRYGSRKRKQDMPSSAARGSVTVTPSSVANQEPHESTPQVNTKSLTACIAAVVSFNFPEHVVKRCAEDMLNQGRLLTAATLLQECEIHCPPETLESYSYFERMRTNNDSAHNGLSLIDVEATSLSPDVNEGSLSSSTNVMPGLISSSGHPTSSRHTNGEVHGESRRSNGVESTAADRISNSHPYMSAQSGEPPSEGEDMIDGYMSSSLYSDSLIGQIQADCTDISTAFNPAVTGELSSPGLLNKASSVRNGLHNGLSRPRCTPGLMSLQDFGSPRQDQYGGSGISTNSSRSAHTEVHTQSNLTDLEHSSVSNTNGDVINSAEQATAGPRRESMATASPSFSSSAEYIYTCFKLIEREHELLEKARKCSECSEKPREVTFLPCGHFIVCRRCSDPLFVCPSCNKSILATVDTYLS